MNGFDFYVNVMLIETLFQNYIIFAYTVYYHVRRCVSCEHHRLVSF